MKLSKIAVIGLITIILLLSVVVGHFLPPTGILITPVIISSIIALIVFTDNGFSVLLKSFLSYLYIGMNDVGIKLFAGGDHDYEGLGFIHLFLFIGLIPCFIMLLIAVISDGGSIRWVKALSIFAFILLICVHFILFNTLGIDQSRYR
jgi:hypothetical protein